MNTQARRPARLLFALYLFSAYGAILLAAPMVRALEPAKEQQARTHEQQARTHASASSGTSRAPEPSLARPTFELCDRNGDGSVDKSEAGRVPGLSAYFERADANKDGKLDREEFEKGVALVASEPK